MDNLSSCGRQRPCRGSHLPSCRSHCSCRCHHIIASDQMSKIVAEMSLKFRWKYRSLLEIHPSRLSPVVLLSPKTRPSLQYRHSPIVYSCHQSVVETVKVKRVLHETHWYARVCQCDGRPRWDKSREVGLALKH